MSIFQNLKITCVRNLVLGLRNTRMMSVSTMLFCASLILASTMSPANGQSDVQKSDKKGIMCYVCNSARDPRCGDPFDSATIEKVDCEQFMPGMNTSVCRKNVQRAILGSKTDYRVIRTCGYLPEAPRGVVDEDDEQEGNEGTNRCYNKAGTFEVQVTYCACQGEGCNNSPRQAWTSLSMVSQTTLQLATMIAGSYLMLNKGLY